MGGGRGDGVRWVGGGMGVRWVGAVVMEFGGWVGGWGSVGRGGGSAKLD